MTSPTLIAIVHQWSDCESGLVAILELPGKERLGIASADDADLRIVLKELDPDKAESFRNMPA